MYNKAKSKKKTESAMVASTTVAKKSKTPASIKVAKPTIPHQKSSPTVAAVANRIKVGNPVAIKQKVISKPKKSSAPIISHDDIALRAYYISEKNQQQGIYKDSIHHWLDAKRQLIAELHL